MTSDEKCLTNMRDSKTHSVTFGDGVKGKVVGKGTLNMKAYPTCKMFFSLMD